MATISPSLEITTTELTVPPSESGVVEIYQRNNNHTNKMYPPPDLMLSPDSVALRQILVDDTVENVRARLVELGWSDGDIPNQVYCTFQDIQDNLPDDAPDHIVQSVTDFTARTKPYPEHHLAQQRLQDWATVSKQHMIDRNWHELERVLFQLNKDRSFNQPPDVAKLFDDAD